MKASDIAYLMSSYLIVADEEINQKELDVLSQNFHEPTSKELEEKQKGIFADAKDKVELDVLIQDAKQLSIEEKTKIIELLYKIAYADGYYDDRENQIIETITNKLKFPQKLKVEIENNITQNLSPIVYTLPWGENLKSIVHRLLLALKDEKEDEHELLSGNRFIQQIRNIANWSKEDLSFAENEMKSFNQFLQDRINAIDDVINKVRNYNAKTEEVKELQKQLKAFNDNIQTNIVDSLRENLAVLNKKKRTISYFTIAFMGRTKAGKSTFHKVVTHEEDDDIGIGKQRTTRYNRSWYWENLRIIDTPGIGAAGEGGRTDEEVARSIIDEADLVCYIVTSDSQQETEFNFLQGLKDRNKPLFIILNFKEKIEERPRFKKFLNDPLKWKYNKGPKCIDGHVQRIKDLIGDKYDFNSIEIIPIQLLAAKMYYSSNTEYTKEQRDKLYEGSNIKEFITDVKKCVYDSGNIKKTQNIIDGCGTQIYFTNKEIKRIYSEISDKYEKISKQRIEIIGFIDRESKKVKEKATKEIESAHSKLHNNAVSFTEEHYGEKKELGDLWKKDRRNNIIYDEMNSNLEKLASDFSKAVNDRIEESMSDMEFLFSLQTDNESIKGKGGTTNKRMYVNILGTLAGLAILSNPFGWGTLVLAGVSFAITLVFNGISRLFKSKEEIIKEKKEKLLKELEANIEKNKDNMLAAFQLQFNNSVDELKNQLNSNFSLILDNSKRLIEHLKAIEDDAQMKENRLNSFFAYRIFQHIYPEKVAPLNASVSKEIILSQIKVERDYERHSMHITSIIANKDDEDKVRKLIQLKTLIN
jgi:GTP-binding protein EngB required for normal cell division/uncharacterized tellurite resistance protein B-like protein